jgi:hypothetical protein
MKNDADDDDNNDDTTVKQILVTGTNNRYQIKKLIIDSSILHVDKILKQSEQWKLNDTDYLFKNQLLVVQSLLLYNQHLTKIQEIVCKQIQQKINGYKNQDRKKKIFNTNEFIHYDYIVQKLNECHMLCYYCNREMFILYLIVRHKLQWTVDRIDNSIGHVQNNINIVCLECNLKRKKTNDAKFMFTSQLCLKKIE